MLQMFAIILTFILQNNQSDNSDYQGNKVVRPVPHHHGIPTTTTFDQQKGRYHLTASRTLRHMSQGFQSSVTPSGSSGNFSKEQVSLYSISCKVFQTHFNQMVRHWKPSLLRNTNPLK